MVLILDITWATIPSLPKGVPEESWVVLTEGGMGEGHKASVGPPSAQA